MRQRFGILLAVLTLALAGCGLPFVQTPQETPAATAVADATPAPDDATPAPDDATAAPDATPAAPPSAEDLERIAAAAPGPRDQLLLAEALKGLDDVPAVARSEPLAVQVGDVEQFYVSDNIANENYQVSARLRYAGPIVLMYVDTDLDDDVSQAAVERSAREFEERIYPRNRALFGEERSPGVDGDPRLTVLNTPVRGAGGYFSSADGVVRAVNRFSNEREMFVISTDSFAIGSDDYGSVLAHEFQHMIEWNEQRRSPSWFNEGMSTLAEDLNGYVTQGTAGLHLAQPDIQLTTWGGDSAQTGQHYGTSQLFLRYFYEQYAEESGLAELIQNDAGNDLEVFTTIARRTRADIGGFADIVADWATANLLNDPDVGDGRYAYRLLPGTVGTEEADRGTGQGEVSQFGADYLRLPRGPVSLSFDGADAVSVTGAGPADGRYAWWSNRGDDSVSTLTREFDLSDVQAATLQFDTWYEIERNWDYAFVTVSIDGGETWTALTGETTTTEDPQGNNVGGQGLTGVSGSPGTETDQGTEGRWISEEFDLSPYAGQAVQLRFWMVHDDAYNASGWMIDNIRIPEIDYSDDIESGDGGWQSEGFVRLNGTLPQAWSLRLARTLDGTTTVEPLEVDANGRATLELADGEEGTLVVLGSTPHTTEKASYSYTIE